MAEPNTQLSNEVAKVLDDLISTLSDAEDLLKFNENPSLDFKRELTRMSELLNRSRLRVAVAGVIKSGKSTFVNALTGKELVQRGAGVVTSITTRIRKGEKNRARIFFKSWDRINEQISGCLDLFPEQEDNPRPEGSLDIRRKEDREYLRRVYKTMVDTFAVSGDQIRPEALMISCALNGYKTSAENVKADESIAEFTGKEFEGHKQYTSDPNQAFFVKDVCLDVYGKTIAPHIEIADCQGSDSTDPEQLQKVLGYLGSANLILYCISSRTGLRQADIAFLRRIQKLGRLDNIIFLNNCDLSEHESLKDLKRVEENIRKELSFFIPKPTVYSFSFLYHFFAAKQKMLRKKDKLRFEMWEQDRQMAQYCIKNAEQFFDFFNHTIEADQGQLLFSNHVKRLNLIAGQVLTRLDLTNDLLSSNSLKKRQAEQKIDHLQKNAFRLKEMVSAAVDASVPELEAQLKTKVHAFFDRDRDSVFNEATLFVSGISMDAGRYAPSVRNAGLNKLLYLLFQDFKREVQLYDLEEVQPVVTAFVGELEQDFHDFVTEQAQKSRIEIISPDSDEAPAENQLPADTSNLPDMDEIKRILGLEIPSPVFKAEYTSKMKVGVFADFGAFTLFNFFKSVIDKGSKPSFTPGVERAVAKLKKQNLRQLGQQFDAYKTVLYNEYIVPLTGACVREFKESIDRQYARYERLSADIEKQIDAWDAEHSTLENKIKKNKKRLTTIIKEVRTIDEKLTI